MKITVTGRHMTITAVLKDYVYSKTEHLEHYFDNLQKIEVIMNPERDAGYSAEMVIHAPRHGVLVGHASGRTATAAIDIVISKMERLLTKYKDKIRSKSARERAPLAKRKTIAPVGASDGVDD